MDSHYLSTYAGWILPDIISFRPAQRRPMGGLSQPAHDADPPRGGSEHLRCAAAVYPDYTFHREHNPQRTPTGDCARGLESHRANHPGAYPLRRATRPALSIRIQEPDRFHGICQFGEYVALDFRG